MVSKMEEGDVKLVLFCSVLRLGCLSSQRNFAY